MRKAFKKYFVPHEGNGHEPHLLRPGTVLFLIGAVLAAETLFFAARQALPGSSFFAEVLPSVLIDETNADRGAERVAPLAASAVLAEAARMKAEDMAAKGYFAHTSPEGLTPWHWLDKAGYAFSSAGENLAVNFFDSHDVAAAWMNSPTHRANLMNPEFAEIGIGTAQGKYEGKDTVFVAQFFGTPASAPIAAEAVPDVLPSALPAIQPSAAPAVQAPESPDSALPPALEPQAVSVPDIPVPASSAVLGVAVARAASAPRMTLGYLLVMLGTIVVFAIALKIIVMRHKGYPQNHGLIMNGVILLIVIASVLVLDGYVSSFMTAIPSRAGYAARGS